MTYAIASPNVVTAIPGAASSADLAAQLIAAFLAGGWTAHAAITGGQTLQGVSPQGYLVWVDIWASNSATVSVMLHSAVGSGCAGFAHQLQWSRAFAWQATTHPCGFFLSQPAVGSSVNGSNCMGGIPMVTSGCGLAAALGTVSEVWFSFGDYAGSPFFYGTSPRLNIGAGDAFGDTTVLTDTISACWDGVMATYTTPFPSWGAPEIAQFSPAAQDTSGPGSHPLFFGEAPMIYPAFIAWPDTGATQLKIRGQLYNAVVSSASVARNRPAAFGGYAWASYTDAYFWGTLFTLAPAAGAGGAGNIQF